MLLYTHQESTPHHIPSSFFSVPLNRIFQSFIVKRKFCFSHLQSVAEKYLSLRLGINLAFEKGNRSLGHLSRIVKRIGADADRPDDR